MSDSVYNVKNSISYEEFSDWCLFYKNNPPIRLHINKIGANIAYTVYSMLKGRGGSTLTAKDFYIDYDKLLETQEDRMKTAAQKIDLVFGKLANKGK